MRRYRVYDKNGGAYSYTLLEIAWWFKSQGFTNKEFDNLVNMPITGNKSVMYFEDIKIKREK